ncbi:hypothetical protein [Aeromonas phage AS-yj]|uniref:Phytanoyl-CoA dioxygenase family protein n=4 Tax=Ceceduovirus TaxID=2842588 RepID=A0A291LDW7_9CAUD|nr:hypothetical protein HWB28_gp168 [Aeromonas phage AS-zj]YP_009835106.1 hypothetical protein HWB29_gp404 [Aeromonas phage AS-sw]ATI17612.1 hypothetical protein [Aeromonas phage AS-szw]ATI17895.1 hypothetical protein [Aeromonas phage AS-yj]QAX98905.1 hypothetical protein assk_109 [Aeromonas phage Assk]QMV28814.1 hypothetical protein AP1_0107 [Aeromonas phage AP1]ASU00384.1 hypothetical protein [Aeromonas phage AS-zj]
MNSKKIFNSKFQNRGQFAQHVSNDEIKNEPMFFNCDLAFAINHGGPITRSFIAKLPEEWQYGDVVFDSRVHMLMPGWYPAIPGYHHDDVPRPDIPVGQHFITAGQPDYDNPRYMSEHILGLVNGDICPTHFAVGEAEFSQVPDGELIYRQWHKEVLEKIDNGELVLHTAPDRTLLQFDWQTWHTGSKTVGNGWRWFGRVSRNTDRVKKISNEIRRNAQVYLEFPMEGW